MNVEIVQLKERAKYEVNGKLIYKDQFGHWQCHDELLPLEKEAFKKLTAVRFKDPRIIKR